MSHHNRTRRSVPRTLLGTLLLLLALGACGTTRDLSGNASSHAAGLRLNIGVPF